MSQNSTTVETIFEMQRETIKETESVVQTAFEFPMEVGKTFYLTGEPGREMRDQMLAVSRNSVHRSLDAIESAPSETPGVEDLRDSVDETFDMLETRNEAACDSVSGEYERVEDEVLETVSEQIETLVEFNEEVESQFTETLDTFSEELETISEEATDEAKAETAVPEDKVECLVCGDYYNAITHPHLQTHDMTIEAYREEFGDDVPLRPDEGD